MEKKKAIIKEKIRDMRKKIEEKIRQFHMLEPGNRVLIGLSGGADSICLAELLWLWKEKYQLTLGAVYCHHGIRGAEADEDGAFVRTFCEERGISFYEVREKVEERAKRRKISVEEAGREFRYETFGHIMKEEGYSVLALAHHANDRAETMLFHLARGTNLSGLCAMEPVRQGKTGEKIIRPLLWTEREEIEAWLLNRQISWRTDSTNLSDLYTRNRLRHYGIPVLREVNEKAVSHMGETADAVYEALDFIRGQQRELEKRCVTLDAEKKRAVIVISLLKEAHRYMQKAVLYQVMAELLGEKKDISKVHVEQLLGLMENQSGKEISLGRGLFGRREYENLLLFFREENGQDKKELLEGIQIKMECCPYTGQEISKNEYTKYFDCDKIKDNLVLRHWQEGDYLYLREDGGKKKLNRYFIDEKIPAEKRKEIPLLADGSHVVWLIGHRISSYYKVTEKTKNLLIIHVQNKG